MREIEIKKWIIRIDDSKEREKANLVGFDSEGNEYTLHHRTYAETVKTDIICEEINSTKK